MKIWLISNTKFGYKNGDPQWLNHMLDYFDKGLISYLEKRAKPGEILVHLGNLFDSSDHISTIVLNRIQDLFERVSTILPVRMLVGINDLHSGAKSNSINSMSVFRHFKNIRVISEPEIENDILYLPWTKSPAKDLSCECNTVLMNSDYLSYGETMIKEKCVGKNIYCGFYNDYMEDSNIIRIGAPYQLEKTSERKGFCVLNTEKRRHVFVENEISPRFKTITITDEAQIDMIDAEDIKKNYVSAIIDSSLIGSKRIKIDVLLSKYAFKNVSYTGSDTVLDEYASIGDTNIVEVCRERLINSDPSILEEFERIVRIKQERY